MWLEEEQLPYCKRQALVGMQEEHRGPLPCRVSIKSTGLKGTHCSATLPSNSVGDPDTTLDVVYVPKSEHLSKHRKNNRKSGHIGPTIEGLINHFNQSAEGSSDHGELKLGEIFHAKYLLLFII